MALEIFRPHAILSDYKLPSFSGIEALRLVRERGMDAAFIIVTGSQTEEVVVECFKLGADDYLLKSSLTRLPGALLNALHRRQAERERNETMARLRERERQLAEAQALAPVGRRGGRGGGARPRGRGPLAVRIHPDDVDLLQGAADEAAPSRSFELVFRIER